jgi:predicted metalloprotease
MSDKSVLTEFVEKYIKIENEQKLLSEDRKILVTDYSEITVEYTKLSGEQTTEVLEGLPAQIVQHEIEHLNGKLMIDHLSRLKRSRAIKRVYKVKNKVSDILSDSIEPEISRIKANSHLSKKEVKIRRQRRKQNRQ